VEVYNFVQNKTMKIKNEFVQHLQKSVYKNLEQTPNKIGVSQCREQEYKAKP